jgi:hypothetical protein
MGVARITHRAQTSTAEFVRNIHNGSRRIAATVQNQLDQLKLLRLREGYLRWM